MKNAKSFLISIAILVCSSHAHANSLTGFLEPYVGFGAMEVQVKDKVYHDFDDKDVGTGFTLGIKGGFNLTKSIFAGLDYNTGGPYDFGRVVNQGEWTQRMLGAGAGIDYGIVRFWAGYYFDETFDDSKTHSTFKATAIKIGFGLLVIKTIHANFEATLHQMQTQTIQGQPSTDISQSYMVQTANLTISMPINFGNGN